MVSLAIRISSGSGSVRAIRDPRNIILVHVDAKAKHLLAKMQEEADGDARAIEEPADGGASCVSGDGFHTVIHGFRTFVCR